MKNLDTKVDLLQAVKLLNSWFLKNLRLLPWREKPTVYRVWVSEIMLQQTRVAAVIPYFHKFISRFPSVRDLAEARENEVLLYWAGLGYYSRARNIHEAAKRIHGTGVFPSTREEWLKIPGVGEYTAGAILSIALNLPEPILDANIKRVIARVQRLGSPYNMEEQKKYWDCSRLLVSTAYQNKFPPRNINQALMELGAMVCLPRTPKCKGCPLAGFCKSYQIGDPEYLPIKKKKNFIWLKEKVYALIDGKNRVLLTNRGNRWRKGLWDFPAERPSGLSSIKMKRIGRMHVRYTVTHHIMDRTCEVYQMKSLLIAVKKPGFRWVSLIQPAVAVGSPGKRLIKTVRKLIQEAQHTRKKSKGLKADPK